MKARDAYMHEANLGEILSDTELRRIIGMHGRDPATLAILQVLRNKTCEMEKAGRQVPPGADPADYRAYHGGAADALEESFWEIYRASQTELDKELEDGK